MGVFSTRNSDGASGRTKPDDTIPARHYANLKGLADQLGMTVAELVEKPTLPGPQSPWNHYDPNKADRN